MTDRYTIHYWPTRTDQPTSRIDTTKLYKTKSIFGEQVTGYLVKTQPYNNVRILEDSSGNRHTVHNSDLGLPCHRIKYTSIAPTEVFDLKAAQKIGKRPEAAIQMKFI